MTDTDNLTPEQRFAVHINQAMALALEADAIDRQVDAILEATDAVDGQRFQAALDDVVFSARLPGVRGVDPPVHADPRATRASPRVVGS